MLRQTLMSRLYLYIKVSLNFNILGCNMVQNWYRLQSEIYSYTRINFRIRITNRVWYQDVTLSAVLLYWKDNNIPNIKTQNRRTERNDRFWWFLSLSLESSSVVTSIQYVCFFLWRKCSSSNVNELRYTMFTKKNLSGVRSPSTSDVLVLHLSINIFSLIFV